VRDQTEADYVVVELPGPTGGLMICVDDSSNHVDERDFHRYIFDLRQGDDGGFCFFLVFFGRGYPTGKGDGTFFIMPPYYLEARHLAKPVDCRHLLSCENVPIPYLVLQDLYEAAASVMTSLPLRGESRGLTTASSIPTQLLSRPKGSVASMTASGAGKLDVGPASGTEH
jgi:hypothetical protein